MPLDDSARLRFCTNEHERDEAKVVLSMRLNPETPKVVENVGEHGI